MSRRCDPEDMSEMFGNFFRVMGEVIERFQGHEANRLGDGSLIYFGYPRAQEDAAVRAVLAATALVNEIRERVVDPEGNAVGVRVGIASGMVVVDHANERSVFGDTPNIAARLQGLAGVGEIVIAESTKALIRDVVEIEPLGPHALKGIAEPLLAWRVLDSAMSTATPVRSTAPPLECFVGRDAEVAQLLTMWQAVCSDAIGQTVVIWGEPGIGKTTISAAIGELLVSAGGSDRWFACSPYHRDTPFYPFVRQLGELPPADGAEFGELLQALRTPESRETRDVVRRRHSALVDGFVRRALGDDPDQPVIIRFDDMQWSDPSSLEVLAVIVAAIKRRRVMLVITSRQAEVEGLTPDLQLQLAPLTMQCTTAIVRAALEGKAIADELIEEIASRADGVPLFAEELARSFDQVRQQSAGPTASSADIPATLQDGLQHRIDSLELGHVVLRLAAVIGRETPIDLLTELQPDAGLLAAATTELLAAGLMEARSGTGMAAPCLVFRHQLILEYAYDTILRRDRLALHGKVADALAKSDTAEPQIRAFHEMRAGRSEAAARCWADAGRLAAARSADREATVHFTRALGLVDQFAEAEVGERFEAEVLLAYLPTMIGSVGYVQSVSASIDRAVSLTTKYAASGQPFQALFLRWLDQLARGGIDIAHNFSLSLVPLAEQAGDEIAMLMIDRMLGSTFMFRGELAAADLALERFQQRYDAASHAERLAEFGATDNYTTVQCCRICIAALAGDIERSRRLQLEMEAEAETSGRIHNICHMTAYGGACAAALRNDWDAMEAHAHRLKLMATTHELPFWIAAAQCYEGTAAAANGDHLTGLALFNEGAEWYASNGVGFLVPTFRVLHASASAVGSPSSLDAMAIHLLDAALEDGERWVRAELLRLCGVRELAAGRAEAARGFLQRSVGVATEQGAQVVAARSSLLLT